MGRTLRTIEDLVRKYPTATIIKDWDELREWAKDNSISKTHELEVEEYYGRLNCLNEQRYNNKKWWWSQVKTIDHYLSTHTFYSSQFLHSTKIMQMCGFNVIIIHGLGDTKND